MCVSVRSVLVLHVVWDVTTHKPEDKASINHKIMEPAVYSSGDLNSRCESQLQ